MLHDDTMKSSEYRERVQQQVRTTYASAAHIDTFDRQSLSTPQDHVLQFSTANMSKWLQRVRPRVSAAIVRSQNRLKSNNTSIRQYFTAHTTSTTVSDDQTGPRLRNTSPTIPTPTSAPPASITTYFKSIKKNDLRPP